MLFGNDMKKLFLTMFFILAVTSAVIVACSEKSDRNIGDNKSFTQDVKSPVPVAKSPINNIKSLPPLGNNDIVYITPNGSCYHRKNCPATARSKNLTAVTKAQAIAKGKRACKKCNP